MGNSIPAGLTVGLDIIKKDWHINSNEYIRQGDLLF